MGRFYLNAARVRSATDLRTASNRGDEEGAMPLKLFITSTERIFINFPTNKLCALIVMEMIYGAKRKHIKRLPRLTLNGPIISNGLDESLEWLSKSKPFWPAIQQSYHQLHNRAPKKKGKKRMNLPPATSS